MNHPRKLKPLSKIETLEARQLLHGDVNLTFNFEPGNTPRVAGTLTANGAAYADRGNGYAYGWDVDNTANVRDRNMIENQLLDTVAFMQNGADRSWELEIANGEYDVTFGSGDARYRDGVHDIWAENTRVMYGVQSRKKQFLKSTKAVTVTDGKLTIHAGPDAVGAKINYMIVRSRHEPVTAPTITITAPDDSATEGEDTGTFRFTRSGASVAQELTVPITWSGSAVRKVADIVSRPGSITFAAGQSTADLIVTPIDDVFDETLETAMVTINASVGHYVVGSPSRASVFIIGTEPLPNPTKPTVTIVATDAAASEAGDTGTIRFTRDSEGLADPLTVSFAWSGSASGADVDRSQTTITFNVNQTTVDLTITPIDDSIDELDETATVTLVANVDVYTVGSPATASVIIADDDETPLLSNVTWASTSAPPISFSETTSLTLNGKIYLFGGFNGAFVPQKNVYSFDGTTWTTLANSPKAFTHTGHAAISSTLAWFAGGYIGNGSGQIFGTSEVFTYDSSTDTWGNAPSLPAARAGGNLVKVGRSVYYFGGENFNRTADMTTMWALDLDNQNAGWVEKAAMPMSRNHASALEVNGKIYVLAGQTGYDGGLTAHDDIQIYDPTNNTWTVPTQKLPANRSHTAQSAFYVHDRIVMITGESAHNVAVNTVWSIDPTTLATTVLGNFPQARFSVACSIFNDKIYAYGGYNGSITTSAYVGTFVLN